MRFYTGNKPKDKQNHADWLNTMVANVTQEIEGYVKVGFSKHQAIKRVRKDSCAGVKVWEIVLKTV